MSSDRCTKKKKSAITEGARAEIEELLVPGGAVQRYVSSRLAETEESRKRWFAYSLLSSISSAIRERAADQNRSTERGESSSASAVSAVVRPAK